MAGHTSDITLERALDSSPSLNRPGRGPGHSGVAPVSKPPSNPVCVTRCLCRIYMSRIRAGNLDSSVKLH